MRLSSKSAAMNRLHTQMLDREALAGEGGLRALLLHSVANVMFGHIIVFGGLAKPMVDKVNSF